MVQRGLADSDARRTLSNEEMGRRIRSGNLPCAEVVG